MRTLAVGSLALFLAVGTAVPLVASDAALTRWLAAYDRTLTSKDLSALGRFYATDATVIAEGNLTQGWSAYRDSHLKPEVAGLEGFSIVRDNVTTRMLKNDAATVVSRVRVRGRRGGADVDMPLWETLIVVKDDDGQWRIRHAHVAPSRSAR